MTVRVDFGESFPVGSFEMRIFARVVVGRLASERTKNEEVIKNIICNHGNHIHSHTFKNLTLGYDTYHHHVASLRYFLEVKSGLSSMEKEFLVINPLDANFKWVHKTPLYLQYGCKQWNVEVFLDSRVYSTRGKIKFDLRFKTTYMQIRGFKTRLFRQILRLVNGGFVLLDEEMVDEVVIAGEYLKSKWNVSSGAINLASHVIHQSFYAYRSFKVEYKVKVFVMDDYENSGVKDYLRAEGEVMIFRFAEENEDS